jgi:hypothetical protein
LIQGDGHPTRYFNKIVADEIKKQVLLHEKKKSVSNRVKKFAAFPGFKDNSLFRK